MMRRNSASWDTADIKKLVRLWKQDKSVREIAFEIGKSQSAIKMYLERHREKLGLEKREFLRVKRVQSDDTEFERKWYGSVPHCHWTITKPWRKQA
jgi:IS30 family transposase